MSAYQVFCKEYRVTIVADHPGIGKHISHLSVSSSSCASEAMQLDCVLVYPNHKRDKLFICISYIEKNGKLSTVKWYGAQYINMQLFPSFLSRPVPWSALGVRWWDWEVTALLTRVCQKLAGGKNAAAPTRGRPGTAVNLTRLRRKTASCTSRQGLVRCTWRTVKDKDRLYKTTCLI